VSATRPVPFQDRIVPSQIGVCAEERLLRTRWWDFLVPPYPYPLIATYRTNIGFGLFDFS
jgi:hypothetical protein